MWLPPFYLAPCDHDLFFCTLQNMKITLEEFCIILYSFAADIQACTVKKFLPQMKPDTIYNTYSKLRSAMVWRMKQIEASTQLEEDVDVRAKKHESTWEVWHSIDSYFAYSQPSFIWTPFIQTLFIIYFSRSRNVGFLMIPIFKYPKIHCLRKIFQAPRGSDKRELTVANT